MALFFNPSPDTIAELRLIHVCPMSAPLIFEPISLYDYVCWYVDRNYPLKLGVKG